MRTFLIFNINDSYYSLYKDYPKSIYNMLNQVYHLKKDNIVFAKNLFNQLVNSFNKEEMNKNLFIKLHKDIPYSKRGNIHIFNNFYLGEITTMEIKNKYIKITSTKDQNYFFQSLLNYNKHLFVCDFENNDYFFLESLVVNNS
ncbi:MAG: sporulation inhibitor of replication protein SirA [Bacilli bacterium]|nr:sporulation inhibitor of replication protein SirA [Bacilli bacterium]